MIKRINGMVPRIQGISISHFYSDLLVLHFEGSSEIDSDADDFEIPRGEDLFLQSYYQSFVSLIENSIEGIRETDVVRAKGREINFVNLEEVDLGRGIRFSGAEDSSIRFSGRKMP